MPKAYISHNSIISALGFGSESVVKKVKQEVSGIDLINDIKWFHKSFYGSVINEKTLNVEASHLTNIEDYTKLEKLMLLSLSDVIRKSHLKLNENVGIIISTTKGNIDVLEKDNKFPKSYAYLSRLSHVIKKYFEFSNEPIIVSNACVSGILAVSIAKKHIEEGLYKHVFIVSGDLVTKFVLSGFNSFQAMSNLPCKPYAIDRTGINLGEAVASALVTSSKKNLAKEAVEVLGEASSNDANHISGPSRTGEGLFRSVKNALQEAKVKAENIDYISAHGTATVFNDEMEAVAFNRLDLQHTPLNSFKGYFGHTLGASALLETIIGMHSLQQNTLFASKGFSTLGVSKPLNIIKKTISTPMYVFLKTASGFGGCNTALVLKKVYNN